MRRMCLVLTCVAGVALGCGGNSDEDQIRQVVQESADDEVHAVDRDPSQWCDTRLVVRDAGWRDLIRRLETGVSGPQEERELRLRANENHCVRWARQYAEELSKLGQLNNKTPEALEEDRGGLDITDVEISGNREVARVDSFQGKFEEPNPRKWVLIKSPGGDWRILQSDEVVTYTPTAQVEIDG